MRTISPGCLSLGRLIGLFLLAVYISEHTMQSCLPELFLNPRSGVSALLSSQVPENTAAALAPSVETRLHTIVSGRLCLGRKRHIYRGARMNRLLASLRFRASQPRTEPSPSLLSHRFTKVGRSNFQRRASSPCPLVAGREVHRQQTP